jgi:hypothetical protein
LAVAFFSIVAELPFGTLGLVIYGLVSWGFSTHQMLLSMKGPKGLPLG